MSAAAKSVPGEESLHACSRPNPGNRPAWKDKGDTGRAFALFYTGVIGAGGFAPIAYGVIADHSSKTIGIMASALTAMVIVPLVFRLRPILAA